MVRGVWWRGVASVRPAIERLQMKYACLWCKTLQTTNILKKKCKEAPAEVVECAALHFQATFIEGEGLRWWQCDICDTWVCSTYGCKWMCVGHEKSCNVQPD